MTVKKWFTKSELLEKMSNFVLKVHLIRQETIEDYIQDNARARSSFTEWLSKLRHADWGKPADMQTTFRTADLLGRGSRRVVFDIAGNNYRLICKYAFGEKRVHLFVCWIGTHAEYDRLCADNGQYFVSNY
jgi:mRNA interferase HigB